MESDTVYCVSCELLEEFRTAEADYRSSTELLATPETAVAIVTTEEEGSSSDTAPTCVSDDLEHSFEDREETETVKHFFSSSCCKQGPNKLSCYKHFSDQSLIRAREESLIIYQILPHTTTSL